MSINAAYPLLAFIRATETGFSDERAYTTMYAHKKISPVLTEMTLDQAIAAGPTWTRKHKSSAAGAYQFMNATLKDLKSSLGLSGSMLLTPFEQDQMGYALLKRRGFLKFLSGEMPLVEFAENLAKEWASFPVLTATQGAHGKVKRGQSYYAGDALNKALVKPEQIEALLDKVRRGTAPVAPSPYHDPSGDIASSPPPTPVAALISIGLVVLVAIVFIVIKNLKG